MSSKKRNWQVGDLCECLGEGQGNVFMVGQVNERGAYLLRPDGRLHGFCGNRVLTPVWFMTVNPIVIAGLDGREKVVSAGSLGETAEDLNGYQFVGSNENKAIRIGGVWVTFEGGMQFRLEDILHNADFAVVRDE